MEKRSSDLVLENSLQAFFYDQLKSLNDKSTLPLPNEAIFYSSLVMDHFGESHKFFEVTGEGIRDKVLGIKLLEVSDYPIELQKRKLREIADTALFVCGYFSESVSRKIVDINHYQQIGMSAYRKLNSFVPEFYDINDFYHGFSNSFQIMTTLMGLAAKNNSSDNHSSAILIINDPKKSA